MTIPTDRLEYVRVEKEVLRVAADALDIAADWNLDDLQVSPPATWGLADPDEPEHAAEGWVSARALAQHFRSLAAAPSPPAEPVAWPTEEELIAFGSEEEHFLDIDPEVYPQMALEILARFGRRFPPPDRLAQLLLADLCWYANRLEAWSEPRNNSDIVPQDDGKQGWHDAHIMIAADLRAILAKYKGA